jgi:type IV pilus assembly protein PilE
MRRFHNRNAGFTMIELMVVVVIVAVLAAIAIPIYGKYIKNSRLTEGTGRIGEVITASKAWAQEHPNATGNPVWPAAQNGGSIGIVDLTSSELFSYAITTGGGDATTTSLVIVASGIAGAKMAGVTVTVTVPNITSNGTPPVIAGL